MTQPKALVLRTAGTNCDSETARALRLAGASTEVLHTKQLVQAPSRLEEIEILVIAGGFSYGDDISAGRVWGHQLRHFLLPALRTFVDRGGLILGVCNGFQVLVEAGLLGSTDADGLRDIALTNNSSNRYECRWVELESQPCACPRITAGERMPVPVAHAEGRFCVKDAATLVRLKAAGQIALVYTDPEAPKSSAVGYPTNPNGSVEQIAGICDPSGRVLGLMPHPERNLDPWNHPRWTRMAPRSAGEGLAFYEAMVAVAEGSPVA